MKLFDSHAHYEDAMFNDDCYEIIDSLKTDKILNCCSDVGVFNKVLEISHKYDHIVCSLGIHPHWVLETPDNYLEILEKCAQDDKVVAIGEMGLDYFWKEPKDIQKRIFIEQLELAKKLNKPVIIHDREAHEDTFEILRQYKPQGVLHRYGGPWSLLKEALDWGMYTSVNCDITYPGWMDKHGECLMNIPLDKLLIETDCPYAPPYNSGKKRCVSDDMVEALKKIAEYRNIDIETLADITYENALKAYNLK